MSDDIRDALQEFGLALRRARRESIGGKTLDVGVDVHGYAPVGVEAVKAFMDGRSAVECDHHSLM